MKKSSFVLLCALFISANILPSCAGIKLYKDENMKTETGLKFYYPKAYVLIENYPSKDVNQKSSIIYLPDLKNPIYAKTRSGIGSADLKVDYENGYLKSFGLITDSKIPESISSIAGLATAIAALKESPAAPDPNENQLQGKPDNGQQPGWELYEFDIVNGQILIKKVK